MNKSENQNITGLKRVLKRYKEKYPNDFTGHTYLENQIERVTPKKVDNMGDCPNGCLIIKHMENEDYCYNCGQALDWSSSDEKE